MEIPKISFKAALLIVVSIIAIILTIAFVASTSFRLFVIGAALLIIGVTVGLRPGALDKRRAVVVTLFAGIGLILILLPSFGLLQSFNPDNVYLPEYTSIWCDRLPGDLAGTFVVNDKGESTCGGPGVNGLDAFTYDGCDYTPDTGLQYKIEEPGVECSFGLLEITPATQSGKVIHVDNGKKICFNENIAFSTTSVRYQATKYGLRINSANGKVIFIKNCDLRNNIDSISNLDYIPGFSDAPKDIPVGSSVNHYIIGFSSVANNKDVVTLNGQKIYIFGIGQYYPIEVSADGAQFANTLKPTADSQLICVPSQNPLCVGGTELVSSIEETPCSMFAIPEGFNTVPGEGIECTYKVSNDQCVQDECRTITVCDDPTKPFRNPITNECEASGQGIVSEAEQACRVKAFNNPLLGYEWVEKETETKGFLGLTSKTADESHCKATFLPYYFLGGVVILLIGTIAFILMPTGKKKKIKLKK